MWTRMACGRLAPAGDRRQADRGLVERVVVGDEAAVADLDARLRRVTAICLSVAERRWPGLRLEAPDVLQALRLLLLADGHRVLRSYEGRSSLTRWLEVIASRWIHRQFAALASETRQRVDGARAAHDRLIPVD